MYFMARIQVQRLDVPKKLVGMTPAITRSHSYHTYHHKSSLSYYLEWAEARLFIPYVGIVEVPIHICYDKIQINKR